MNIILILNCTKRFVYLDCYITRSQLYLIRVMGIAHKLRLIRSSIFNAVDRSGFGCKQGSQSRSRIIKRQRIISCSDDNTVTVYKGVSFGLGQHTVSPLRCVEVILIHRIAVDYIWNIVCTSQVCSYNR
ncbi:hypothetical protein D3C73_1340120 [compost metagenome]